jgi:DNA topoisomerase-1
MAVDRHARWWRRVGTPGRFRYVDPLGKRITDAAQLARIQALRLPPAWTDVRIAPSDRSSLQAFGFDAKGRKQYVYHPRVVAAHAAAKYNKLVAFAEQLPRFREVTSAALGGEGLGRERVLALVTRLINVGCFRVGGERYARENRSYGIATLTTRHLRVHETSLRFNFPGKHGVKQNKVVHGDPELAGLVREVASLPGKRLFQYDGPQGVSAVTERDVNAYIKQVMGPDFSAKDFRTWGGTLLAARILAAYGPAETPTARKRIMQRAVRAVANFLGNTPAIARASYISPAVFAAYERGLTLKSFEPKGRQRIRLMQAGYTDEEIELMRMLSIEPSAKAAPDVRVTVMPDLAGVLPVVVADKRA